MLKTSEKTNRGTATAPALGLVFLSGFAALVYQVLWMKQIGLLFGNTSHAASATLASFFLGLAAGSWALGSRVSTATNPMRTYAWLELGIAATALLYYGIMALYHAIYPAIYQAVGTGGSLTVIRFALSLLLVFPPAFCMGGTIPALGQWMVREKSSFGKTAALMYGVNTLGAASGAVFAGFFLPLWIGFNATCALAISVSVAVALVAFRLPRAAVVNGTSELAATPVDAPAETVSRQERRRMEREGKRPKAVSIQAVSAAPQASGRGVILCLSFLSGFGVLALEVLWTRLFSQVLENSVYTFAAILVVVLVCLAIGALISSFVARLRFPPILVLTMLLLAGGGAVLATPPAFLALTNGMQIISSAGSWGGYVLLIFRSAFLVIGPSAILLGTVFPYLMKVEERHLQSAGLSLGKLAAANTIGAVLGALLCGFLMLDWLGIWRGMQLVAVIYLFAALILPLGWDARSLVTKAACGLALLLGLVLPKPGNMPLMSADPLSSVEETLIEAWEGGDCTVSVTESERGRAIRINSHYSLGSTGAYMQEKFQADLPLFAYPESESVFFLGVGTGITAGSALGPIHANVKRIVACELVPEVITAAKKHMTDFRGFDTTGGLFTDPRATVLIEDGRHHLMATNESFDIINSDLFVPFRSGAGSLYSREHFEAARERLTPQGVFVQWLPLYQLTEYEFSIIAKTMIGVFGEVTMWRHNFQPGDEVVALIGRRAGQALPASAIDSSADKLFAVSGKDHRDIQHLSLPLNPQTILLFYCGNLTEARTLFAGYPENTDDRPVIEYMAPRTYRSSGAGASPWFTGARFADLVGKVHALCPPGKDPHLANRSSEDRRLPLAGQALHRARIAEAAADIPATVGAWEEFVTEWTDR
ncbi:fused MFS/spermidine synthase [Akkermansiaceae bacterium]|nr:fused MFS/spermidine synthase [Akkermansiaceae bacterium]